MPLACKLCIMTKGLKGSEIGSLPKNDEELVQHMERDHHVPVRRDSETPEECLERFKRENPEAGGPNCKCPSCMVRKQLAGSCLFSEN